MLLQVAELIKQNKAIPRVDQESAESQLLKYKQIVDNFLAADIDTENLEEFFKEKILPMTDEDTDAESREE